MSILKIEKLTKKYGKTYALNGLDMEVKKRRYLRLCRTERCGKNNDAAHYFRAFKERRRRSVAGRRADDKKYSEAEKPDRLCA